MRDFFRGWRRKVGVLTLVLACVFMAGWVRSLTTLDVVKIPLGKSYCHCCSCKGWFGCRILPADGLLPATWKWTTRTIDGASAIYVSDVAYETSMLYYWPKVVSLILISAYLLLFKPQPAKPTTTSVRFDDTGTRRHHFEVFLVAFTILSNLDIISALQLALS